VAESRAPAAWKAPSSGSTARSVVAKAGTWTDWKVDGSMTEAGDGPADPAIPGNAPRARAAVSAAIATTRERRNRHGTIQLHGLLHLRTPSRRCDLRPMASRSSAPDIGGPAAGPHSQTRGTLRLRQRMTNTGPVTVST